MFLQTLVSTRVETFSFARQTGCYPIIWLIELQSPHWWGLKDLHCNTPVWRQHTPSDIGIWLVTYTEMGMSSYQENFVTGGTGSCQMQPLTQNSSKWQYLPFISINKHGFKCIHWSIIWFIYDFSAILKSLHVLIWIVDTRWCIYALRF